MRITHAATWNLSRRRRLAQDTAWVETARGRAVKIVLLLLSHLPLGELDRIIHGDMREVIASQAAMLRRLGRPAPPGRPGDRRILRGPPDIGIPPLLCKQVLSDPAGTAEAVSGFLGRPFDVKTCAAAIDPRLRRQRAP